MVGKPYELVSIQRKPGFNSRLLMGLCTIGFAVSGRVIPNSNMDKFKCIQFLHSLHTVPY